jgi:hypothetical protein
VLWTTLALTACAALVVTAVALRSGWRPGAHVPVARAASAATTSTPSASTIGAIMSDGDPTIWRDGLGPFASEESGGSTDVAAATEGAAGADGAEGPMGPEGPAGAEGAAGADGSVGATGPAGIGLSMLEEPTSAVAVVSPDGTSYRVLVTNTGVVFQGPATTQTWSDTSHFQLPLQ